MHELGMARMEWAGRKCMAWHSLTVLDGPLCHSHLPSSPSRPRLAHLGKLQLSDNPPTGLCPAPPPVAAPSIHPHWFLDTTDRLRFHGTLAGDNLVSYNGFRRSLNFDTTNIWITRTLEAIASDKRD